MFKLALSFFISASLSALLIARQAAVLAEIRHFQSLLDRCVCDLYIWSNAAEASREYIQQQIAVWFDLIPLIVASLTATICFLLALILCVWVHMAYAIWEQENGLS